MKIISRSVTETLKLGKKIAKILRAGDIVCLYGNLGAGKTVLAKGIAGGLGIRGEEVVSPSFVLIRQYPGDKFPLYHFDLYRLQGPPDILALGYEEFFYDQAVSIVEWAEKLGPLLPEEYLKITLSIGKNNQRIIELCACGRRYEEVLKKIK